MDKIHGHSYLQKPAYNLAEEGLHKQVNRSVRLCWGSQGSNKHPAGEETWWGQRARWTGRPLSGDAWQVHG